MGKEEIERDLHIKVAKLETEIKNLVVWLKVLATAATAGASPDILALLTKGVAP